jgi:RNA ligase
MVHLRDLFDVDLLEQRIEDGYIKVRSHPVLPLRIYNYAEKAAYERVWDAVTSQCRGLITTDDGEVVARPWPKFFNLGEHPEDAFDLDAPVEVTDKQDGSLGILVPAESPFLATRGSFESDQARHATALYRSRYLGTWAPRAELTYLFEIVFPANRIVLDYGGTDDLILLGSVDTTSGRTFGPAELAEWPGRSTQVFAHATLRDALAVEPRPNAEGFVVRFPATDTMVKIKQADYLALHRIVTGLNARVVWEHCVDPKRVDPNGVDPKGLAGLLESLPDEFQQWAIGIAADLDGRAHAIELAAREEYAQILRDLDGTPWTRKEFAEAAKGATHTALLFQLLDNRDLRPGIWKSLRPSGELVPRDFGEDTA